MPFYFGDFFKRNFKIILDKICEIGRLVSQGADGKKVKAGGKTK